MAGDPFYVELRWQADKPKPRLPGADDAPEGGGQKGPPQIKKQALQSWRSIKKTGILG